MKIKVSIYNDDEAETRDIQVLELAVGHEPKRTVIEPGESIAKNMATFEILGGDILVITATGQ